MRRFDGGFPPALHLITAAIGAVFGQESGTVVWTGLLWLALWGFAVVRLGAAWSLGPAGSGFAGAVAMLLPAAHGLALRYYFDLPMGAFLVLSLAAVRRFDREALPDDALAATLWALLACTTKWTAAPWFVLGSTATVLAGGGGHLFVRCARGLTPVAAVVLILLALGDGSLAFQSVRSMAEGMASDARTAPPSALASVVGDGVAGMLWTSLSPERWTACRVLFHPAALVRAWWAPLALIAAAPLLVSGLSRRGPIRTFVLLFSALHLGVAVGLIRVLDERWDLPWAAVTVLAVAAGFDHLRAPLAGKLGAVTLLALLWAGTHHHFGTPPLWHSRLEVIGCSATIWPAWAGLAPATTADGIALSRRDEEPPYDREEREALFEVIDVVAGERIAVVADGTLLGGRQDQAWLAYAVLEGRVLGGAMGRSVDPVKHNEDVGPADTAITAGPCADEARWPFTPAPFVLERRVPVPAPGRCVDLWRRLRSPRRLRGRSDARARRWSRRRSASGPAPARARR